MSYTFALVIGLAGFLVIYRIFTSLKYPHAPGPFIARWTNLWYAMKTWEGGVDSWNIQAHAKHGPVIRVGPKSYSIDSPAATALIYGTNSKMPKSKFYAAFGHPLIPNHNLFSAVDQDFHSQMRKRAASMYSMTTIKSYEPIVDESLSILLQRFDEIAEAKQGIDFQKWMQFFAFDTIGKMSWGYRIGFLDKGGQDVGGIVEKLGKGLTFSSLVGVNKLLAPLCLLIYGHPIAGAQEFINRIQTEETKDKRDLKVRKMQKSFADKLNSIKEDSPEDFEKYHLDSVLVANVAAGSDTTGIALTALWYFVCKNPSVYVKLRKEFQDAVRDGKVDNPITFDQAIALPYLQSVIKESMRLHAAVGLPLWRVVDDPAGFEVGGTVFPKGSVLGVNSWVAHANKSVFGDDAADFRPERWDPVYTPQDKLKEMERNYMPFGLGTRTCMGRHISMLEICKLVPELIRRYDLCLDEKEVRKTRNHWFVYHENVRMFIELRSVKDNEKI